MALVKDKFSHVKEGTGTVRCINGIQTLIFRLSKDDSVISLPLPGCNRVRAIAVLVNAMELSLIDYDGKYQSEILSTLKQVGTSSTFKLGRRYNPLYVKRLSFDDNHQYTHSLYAVIVKCCGLLRFDDDKECHLIMERCIPLSPADITMHAILSFMNRLKVMHDDGVVHEDIMPDNLMLSKHGDIVLVDPSVVVGANVVYRSQHYTNVIGDDVRLKPLKERMALDVQLALQSFIQIRYNDNFSDFVYHNGMLLDSRPDSIASDEYCCTDWNQFTSFQSCEEFLTSPFAAKARNKLLDDITRRLSDTESDDYDDDEDEEEVSYHVRNRSFLVDES
uniref:VP7 n=1 Tax=viral metagenome TaxID=1070528 RepID=A0A2V0R9L0_9ZZZZ